jgi:ABC-type multidrug transport system permease subunit
MNRRYLAVATAIAGRNLRVFFTHPALFLPGLLFPLFWFTAFVGGLTAVRDVPGFDYPAGYTTFEYVFVMLQSAAFGGVFTGFSIARDFESRFARRFMLAAPRRSAIIAGYALACLARWVFVIAVVTVIALIVGLDIGGSGIDLFGLVVLALLVNLAAVLWAAGVAMRFRSLQAGPLMQTPIFLLLFLAPVYVPLDLLTGWIHAVAKINPVTYVLEAGRGLIAGDPVYVALAFALAFALGGLFMIWSRRGLRSAEMAGA